MIRMKMLTPEAYAADEAIVHLGREEIAFLKAKVHENERKRVRVCAHKNAEDKLHEMFVIYSKETYIRPNKHLNHKDESLHILEGAADFIFLDEQGELIKAVPLGDYSTGRQVYCRIPETIYHTFIIHSDFLVIHETIPGPFIRSDTVFAPWAPVENDLVSVQKYMKKLETTVNSSGTNR